MKHVLLLVLTFVFIGLGQNQAVWSQEENTEVGSDAAQKYFKKRQRRKRQHKSSRRPNSSPKKRAPAVSGAPRYLSIHLGGFLSDDSFRIGPVDKEQDVGQVNAGVTYRIGEWRESMDLLFRADVLSYKVANGKPVKISFMPIVAFPDARSEFPLYFGAGAGLGVYLKNVGGEEDLSFDYQLITGGRFFNIWDSVGLMFEFGMKNHINILSDGQFNGVFFSLGSVFSF